MSRENPKREAALVRIIRERLALPAAVEDVFAYIVAIGSNPAYTHRFASDLGTPPLRIPFTSDPKLFQDVVETGRTLIWLQTFGERFVDATAGRPHAPPRLPKGTGPTIPAGGGIPADRMPDEMTYDPIAKRLHVGDGVIDNVAPTMWDYAVGGKYILRQWFSYRKADRSRPIMGDRRPPSPLGEIQPTGWPAEYTTDLLNLLHVVGLLVGLEDKQATLLAEVCNGDQITAAELATATAALPTKGKMTAQVGHEAQLPLLD